MDSSQSATDLTDDEFDIEENATTDSEAVLQRLKEFTYYLVENIEFNLNFCLKLLEERTVPPKSNSMHVTALSLLCSAIPKIGGGLSSTLKTGEVTMFRKIEKKNSRILADLVYYFSDNKEEFRLAIIEAAAEVFASFETQFMQLTCKGGEKRAMMKLAIDASDRIFNYFLITEQKRDVTKDEIIKGVIFGDSKRNKRGMKEGKSVVKNDTKTKTTDSKEIKWKTCKLYSKSGIVILDKNLFYKTEETKPQKYGYRKLFSWEDEDEIKKTWILETDNHKIPEYTLEITEDLIKSAKEYVMTKNPNEEAKLEREKYSEEAMDDRQQKHEEALKILKDCFDKILNEMNDLVIKVSAINLENAELLKTVAENQEKETKLQDEIISKLDLVHDNVLETKEKQEDILKTNEDIKSDIVEIKTNQEEMASVVVKQEDVQQIINDKVKESAKDGVKEYVRETLRNNDPGPKIKRETERFVKQTKEELKRFEKTGQKMVLNITSSVARI